MTTMRSVVGNTSVGSRAAMGQSHAAGAGAAPAGRPRRGYTLLEVLLSLVLASLVLLAVAMAVDFQLRVVDRSRGDVEEAQLARVLLQRIARDLRGAVPKDPLNMAELVEKASAAAESAAGEDSEGEGGESAAGSGEDSQSASDGSMGSQDSGSAEDDETDTGDTDEGEDSSLGEAEGDESSTPQSTPQSTPGVYGDAEWLQVDVGILPRLDQFDAMYASTEGTVAVDRLSDVKTVTYYVVESDDESGFSADGTPTGGLVRREQDRAVGLWNSDGGSLDEDPDVTPIAPEVTAIAFQYWDGSEWAESWDTEESGGLPAAVEITLTIRPIRDPSESVNSSQTSTRDLTTEEELFTYTLIVPLLAAQASSGDEMSEEMSESSEMSETSESGSTETADRGEASR